MPGFSPPLQGEYGARTTKAAQGKGTPPPCRVRETDGQACPNQKRETTLTTASAPGLQGLRKGTRERKCQGKRTIPCAAGIRAARRKRHLLDGRIYAAVPRHGIFAEPAASSAPAKSRRHPRWARGGVMREGETPQRLFSVRATTQMPTSYNIHMGKPTNNSVNTSEVGVITAATTKTSTTA